MPDTSMSLDSLVGNFKPPTFSTPVETVETVADTTTTDTSTTDDGVDSTTTTTTTDTSGATGTPTTDDSGTDSSDEPSFTQLLKSEYIPDYEDDFEPTYEGVSNLVKTVAETQLAAGREAVVNELFSAYPEMEKYLEYRMQGGDPAKYFEVMGQGDSTFDATTEAGQKQIVREYLKASFDEDEIAEQMIILEETGKLKDKAEKYQEKLSIGKSSQQEALLAQQAQQAKDQEEATKSYWTTIKSSIDAGKVGNNTVIPQPERKNFFEWLSVPKENGMSQQQLEWSKMSDPDKLAFQYFLFKKGDVSKLAARSAETKKVDEQIKKLAPGARMEGNNKDKSTSPARIALTGGISGVKFTG